jgi:hypothetical protein
MSSRFYITDDDGDPDAPRQLYEYNGLCPGMLVRYANPHMPGADLPEPLVLTALFLMQTSEPGVQAILNDGEWEVNADNLVEAT